LKATKVIIVTYPDSFRLQEAKSLIDSLTDCQIVKVVTQKYLNRSEYGLGSGKAEEVKQFVKECKADQIVVDEHLTSRQIHNLGKLTGTQVIDRERLILNIFHSRATTTEAKLQIELAEIKYEIPRIRENAKLTSGSERPGKGGIGVYVVDVKFRDLKRRMSFIKEKLADAHKKRELYRKQRLNSGMPVVSLVGYTSSGKTTLFNLLTAENKDTASSMFTTLSTTTRSFKIDNHDKRGKEGHLLLIDTIGFISRLPHYMVDAFKSTLEESLASDLILLLIDMSDKIEDIRIKYESCWDVLDELKVDKLKVFVILTKVDCITYSEQMKNDISNNLKISNPLAISSKTGYGIHRLRTTIANHTHTIKLAT